MVMDVTNNRFMWTYHREGVLLSMILKISWKQRPMLGFLMNLLLVTQRFRKFMILLKILTNGVRED